MVRKGWFAVLAAATLTGCASEPAATLDPTGTVQGLFVEHLPGILLERTVAGDPADRPTWVWVRFSEPQDGRSFVTARVESGTDLAPGDIVRIQLAGIPDRVAPEPRAEHRIVAVLSRAALPADLTSERAILTNRTQLH
jgi:hypothetical protein